MMTDQESAFVEEMGQLLGLLRHDADGRPDVGLAAHLRSARADRRGHRGRTPREPRRDQRDRADSSSAGFIRRSTRPGDRREYFSAPPEALEQFMGSAGRAYRQLRELMEQGLAAMDGRSTKDRERLQELHDVMAFIETEVPALLERYQRDRATRSGQKGATR